MNKTNQFSARKTMIYIAKILSVLLLVAITGGLLGNLLGPNLAEGLRLIPVAVPLAYFAWLVWQALKPVKLGLIKFCLAHLAPGFLVVIGLIFLFAPNKVVEFMISGVGLICVGGMLIYQMHLQRRCFREAVIDI